jgi:hypothetical protein
MSARPISGTLRGQRRHVEAEKKFRRVHGWRDIAKLMTALRELEAKEETTTERVT